MTSVFMYAGLVDCKFSNIGHFSCGRLWARCLGGLFNFQWTFLRDAERLSALWAAVHADASIVQRERLSNLHLWQQETTDGWHTSVYRDESHTSSRLTGLSVDKMLTVGRTGDLGQIRRSSPEVGRCLRCGVKYITTCQSKRFDIFYWRWQLLLRFPAGSKPWE
jgi:hypothetical protein